MSDTQRSRAEILALFADNVTGSISAADLRDFTVTVMEADFQFAGDFFTEPKPNFTTTDKTGRGWIDYSCIAGSDLSFGDAVCYDTSTSFLIRAHASNSNRMPVIGLTLDSYASNASNVQILRRGLFYDSSFSGAWSGFVGRPVYLAQGSAGRWSVTLPASVANSYPPIIGIVEASTTGTFAGSGKFRFDPMWFVVGT
jgi:hypothetical protein